MHRIGTVPPNHDGSHMRVRAMSSARINRESLLSSVALGDVIGVALVVSVGVVVGVLVVLIRVAAL